MSETPDVFQNQTADSVASDTGLAVAFVNGDSREVRSSNNNSICRTLNPDGRFSPACSKYCGRAFEKTHAAGKMVGYVCHAGLECRAVPFSTGGGEMTAIIGRAFTAADNYRAATERAMNDDWRSLPINELFDNVLLASSAEAITEAAVRFRKAIEKPHQAQTADPNTPQVEPDHETMTETAGDAVDRAQRPGRDKAAAAWRSFFGSVLDLDYKKAYESILDFLARQFDLSDIVWMERRGDRLVTASSYGELRGRRIRLGLAADDPRLIAAHNSDQPVELSERRREGQRTDRTLSLFPVGVGGEITAAVAVLHKIEDDAKRTDISRFCRTIAPQLEILRLRYEVARGDTLVAAVRSFSESLKRLDSDDVWLNLTQNAAELLKAERASLLTLDEKSGKLDIKALVGAEPRNNENRDVGSRVAVHVIEKREPVAVADTAVLGLPPTDRKYKTSSFLSCPILIDGRIVGVMNFTDRASGEPFDEESLELFQAIAPQLAVAVDRAALKAKAGEFEQLSVTDPLTGLLNRRYIQERLQEEIKRSNRHGYPMSLMMLDVDQFKSYNDEFGHPAGDQALILVGSVIRETLRSADVASRFGGEEFSILLPQTTADEALMIAERIRQNVQSTRFPNREVTVSIGVASCSAELCISTDLISAADQALYRAKRMGRNRVLAYEAVTPAVQTTGTKP